MLLLGRGVKADSNRREPLVYYSQVQCSAVQCSVSCSTVQFSTVYCSIIDLCAIKYNAVHYTVQHCTLYIDTCSAIQHSVHCERGPLAKTEIELSDDRI